jgi:hypothetical protein
MLGRPFRKATRSDQRTTIEEMLRAPLRKLKERPSSNYDVGKEGGLEDHMIKELQIRNYKSVRAADLSCKRVNVFIGPPCSGKSNILQAIALLNIFGDRNRMYDDEELNWMLGISCWADVFWGGLHEWHYSGEKERPTKYPVSIRALRKSGETVTVKVDEVIEIRPAIEKDIGVEEEEYHRVECSGSTVAYVVPLSFAYELLSRTDLRRFAFYRFRLRRHDDPVPVFIPVEEEVFLAPPFGYNLGLILNRDEALRQRIEACTYKLELEKQIWSGENNKVFFKCGRIEGIAFHSLPETLQRFIFYLTATYHNMEMVVAIDDLDPIYPSFSACIARAIAANRFNQYFISTHDPFFLLCLLREVPTKELNVFGTELDGGETKVHVLTEKLEEKILVEDLYSFFKFARQLKAEKGTT